MDAGMAEENLRRAQTDVKRPLAGGHALEPFGEGGLLGRRERGEPQTGVREEIAVPIEASPLPNDKGPEKSGIAMLRTLCSLGSIMPRPLASVLGVRPQNGYRAAAWARLLATC